MAKTQRLGAVDELALLQQILGAKTAKQQDLAWSQFCQRYEALIIGCILRVLRRYNATFTNADLSDLVGEVWVTLLRNDMRKLRQYQPDRGYRLSSWIGLIAVNSTIDQLRTRQPEPSYLEEISSCETLLVDASRPDQSLDRSERSRIARHALAQLTSAEQDFVVSCFRDETPPTELAEDLGVSINTVYSRKFKLRQKLTRIVAALAPASA